jgi:hypothetical protein
MNGKKAAERSVEAAKSASVGRVSWRLAELP